MFTLIDEAKLSPEKAAELLGVSGMTLRRWREAPPAGRLPKIYERAVEVAVQQLVVDGYLDPSSPLTQSIMSHSSELSFQATLKSMGFADSILKEKGNADDALMLGLSQIGSVPSRIKGVDDNVKKISAFSKMGEEWKRRIGGLLKVVQSKNLTQLDKLVAYGALFYLLTPFDLIPDTIPVFGYLDDFAILGLAMAYYLKRYPVLFKKD